MLTATSTFLLLQVVWIAIIIRHQNRKTPPGPKRLPLLGNLLNFPMQRPWLVYDKWKKEYGDVIYMNVLGKHIVVLNSLQACTDLLDKRSAKYSSRPRMVMISELMGWDANLGMMEYSPRWRRHRRLFHEYFNENACRDYLSIQQRGSNALLQRLLKDPEHLFDHLRTLLGETIMELTYGIKVQGANDVFLKQAEDAMHSFILAAVPGKYLVEVFPILKYLPAWLPGAGFKTQAAEWRELGQRMRNAPYIHVKEKLGQGTASPSVLTSMLSNHDEEALQTLESHGETLEKTIQDCAAAAYLGGADTSLSAFHAFFLAIANYPEVQKAAQAELDTLLGDSRLPTFEDARDLPFIEAIIKELLRWHNTAPLGFAHCLTEDDEYNGYVLPKGTVVLGNVWSILHDPDVYPDPLKFNPWRWTVNTPTGLKLNEALPDPDIAAFGFGRRGCPGRHFALNALFMTIASVLACFNIRPLDSKGQPVERIEEEFTNELISYPECFNVSITPRSDRIRQLLRDMDSE